MYVVILTNNLGKYAVMVESESEKEAIQIAIRDAGQSVWFTKIEAVLIRNYAEFKK